MSDHKDPDLRPMPEQIIYANILSLGAWGGIVLLLATYGLYMSGLLEPSVDTKLVTQSWGLPVHEYMEVTGSPHGWDWLNLIGTGDFLNFIGLALLATLTIVCYMVLLPGFFRRKDWSYFTIAMVEILVLCVAASGLLGSGGH